MCKNKVLHLCWETFLLTIALVFINAVNVFAETKELTMDINADYTNAVFSITWENYEKEAEVEILSPDGKTFSEKTTPDNIYSARGEVMVSVGVPAKGQWKIKVTGDRLGKIDVSAGQLPDSIIIDSFVVKEEHDKYVAEYKVSDCPEDIYVEIFADTDSEAFGGERVYSGNTKASGMAELSMNYLTAGEYHFYIRVSVDGIYKRQYADQVLGYQPEGSQEKVQEVVGGKYNDGYYLSWLCENEYDRFTIYVWDEEMNLKLAQELQGEDFYYNDFEEGEEHVTLAVVNADRNCGYDKIEVSADTNVEADVTFDVEEEITSHQYIVGEVSFLGDCVIDVWLNHQLQLEGETEAGDYKVTMEDGDNEIVFMLTDEKNNKKEFVKEVYVDTVPPALAVTEDINHLKTAEEYVYVSGYSEVGAVVELNGRKVTLQKGYFNEKVNLDYGNNQIKLVATDAAGNQSVYTAVVNYEIDKKSRRELYIIAGTAMVLAVLYIIVFIRGMKRRKAK